MVAIAYAAVSLSIFMIIVWLVYLKLRNAGIVDCAWSLGHVVAGGVYFSFHGLTMKSMLFLPLLLLWALRLAAFLFVTRIYHSEVDKRYETIASNWKRSDAFGFFWNYQLQALLIFILSLPLYFISQQTSWRMIDTLFAIVMIAAIYFEHQSDMTLLKFKQQKNKGVCDKGWWARSRHPNYFFEWLIWCMVAAMAIDSWVSLIALVSPLGLYVIMNFITGPITEAQSLKRRGQLFSDYQARVPMFFPRVGK